MISLILTLAAHAGGTYTFDAPIVGSVPPAAANLDHVGWYHSWPVAAGEADFEVQSTWPYIACGVRDGSVYARFVATENNWPSSFPAVVTCAHAGYTLHLNLVPRPGPWVSGPMTTATASGVTLHHPPVAGDRTGGFRVFFLPHPGFQDGLWPATSGGADWTDVSCAVAHADGQAFLRIWAWPSAPAGSGSCDLPLVGGGVTTIPVTITR